MDGEVTPEQARRILDMLTQGGAMEDINTPLALRLIPLAIELEDETLADRLLAHAKNIAADEIESGWASFEEMKICLLYTSPSPRDAHESRMPSSA